MMSTFLLSINLKELHTPIHISGVFNRKVGSSVLTTREEGMGKESTCKQQKGRSCL